MKIYEGDLAKSICKNLYEINQYFKNEPTLYYFYEKGNVFTYGLTHTTQCYGTIKDLAEGKPLVKIKGKKNPEEVPIVKNQLQRNTYEALIEIDKPLVIFGIDLFKFYSDNKKNINGVKIDENGLEILTDIPKVSYLIKPVKEYKLEQQNYNKTVRFFEDLNKDIEEFEDEEYYCSFDNEIYDKMKERKFSSLLFLDIENDCVRIDECNSIYKIPLKFHSKFFISFKKDTVCDFYVYPTKLDEKVFIVKIYTDNKYCRCNQYIKIVEY